MSVSDSGAKQPSKYTAIGAWGLFGLGIGQHELHHENSAPSVGTSWRFGEFIKHFQAKWLHLAARCSLECFS